MTRLQKLQNSLKEQNIDMICLAPGAHMRWLLGLGISAFERPLLFCLSQNGAAFLTPTLEAGGLRQKTDFPLYRWSDADGPEQAMAALILDLGVQQASHVALDEAMRADFAALVQGSLPAAKCQFCASTITPLRMCKDSDELQALRKNARIADAALRTAWSAMRPEMRESEVADLINSSFKKQGANPEFAIVAAGGNGAFAHHHAGERALQLGDAVVMDIGASTEGYFSDITRMAVIGHPPEGYERCHAIVNDAVEAALEAARPGVLAKTVDQAARDLICKAGYGEYFVHRTGHGIGSEVHEPPYLTSSSNDVLEEGMTFSIEPGIYLPQRFGIRLEEIVILTSSGPEILSELPRDWVTIDV